MSMAELARFDLDDIPCNLSRTWNAMLIAASPKLAVFF